VTVESLVVGKSTMTESGMFSKGVWTPNLLMDDRMRWATHDIFIVQTNQFFVEIMGKLT
jgi:hypothetical protein